MTRSVQFYVRHAGCGFGAHPQLCPTGEVFEVRSRLLNDGIEESDDLLFVSGRVDGASRLADLLAGQRDAGRSEGRSDALGDVRKHFKAGHSEGYKEGLGDAQKYFLAGRAEGIKVGMGDAMKHFKDGMCKGVKLATQAAVDRCRRAAEEYAEERHDEAEELSDVVQKRLNDALAQLGS